MSFHVGSAFIWHKVSAVDPHRHIVITEPDELNGVVTVTLSSMRLLTSGSYGPHENTCIVRRGEHEFITRQSYVRFDLTQFRDLGRLEHDLGNGYIEMHEPASGELLDRLLAGVMTSKRTPQDIKILFI